ncbi:MAG: hypothetical protein ACXAC5_01865 [Promethearchaeota archaeon]
MEDKEAVTCNDFIYYEIKVKQKSTPAFTIIEIRFKPCCQGIETRPLMSAFRVFLALLMTDRVYHMPEKCQEEIQ